MKLLRVIPTVDPKGGGPMEGARKIDAELLKLGHQIDVVCLDSPGETFLSAYPAPVTALGPSKSGYQYNSRLIPWLRSVSLSYDAVIVNGLWQYHGYAVRKALAGTSVPYFVFTHGMLDPWFKKQYPLKHLKKWLYWPWAEYRVLRDAQAVLFTSEEERLAARRSFWLYRCVEKVTAYGTSDVPQNSEYLKQNFLSSFPEIREKRIVLFLGRIHEKKGCDLLIEAFAKISSSDPSLHLVMAGPDQTNWSTELKARSDALGVAARITWTGMLAGDMKWGAFYASEVFCLPSHQENFGIAVAEALACGKPVLISDKVNIWREISEDGAGWVEPDTSLGTENGLAKWAQTSPDMLRDMGLAARECFNSRFRIERVAESLIKIIHSYVSR